MAVLAVYFAGRLLGGFLGRRVQRRIEGVIPSLPVFKQVHPYVQQVVDFLFSDDKPIKFNRVVVVEYPVERGKPPFRIGELVGVRNRRYGRTALAFYAFKPSGALEALRPRPEEFEEFS